MQHIYACRFVMFLAVALFSGCAATPKQVADQTVNMSVAIEDANNRMLLLNIVRAYYRLPMQFFRVNALHGTSGTGVMGATSALPISHFQALTLFGGNYKLDQPTFDLTVLDSQEFMQGITTPLSAESFNYFIEQGWPPQLLMFLFIRRIELTKPDQHGNPQIDEYINYPGDEDKMLRFAALIELLSQCDIALRRSDKEDYGPLVDIPPHFPADKLAATKINGLELVNASQQDPKSRQFQLKKAKTDPLVSVSCRQSAVEDASNAILEQVAEKEGSQHEAKKAFQEAKKALDRASNLYERDPFTFTIGDHDPRLKPNRIFFRSVEAMIYYLGEITRALHHETAVGEPCGDRDRVIDFHPRIDKLGEPAHLFVLECAPFDSSRSGAQRVADSSFLSVDYGGNRFWVPGKTKDAGRTNHVLMLIAQLLASQNKATEAPVTGSVRLVN